MRFRADITSLSTFSRLIASLSPLSKVAILKLKSDTIHLICIGDGQSIQTNIDSQIQVASIFDITTFRLESNANNEIYLEVSTEALGRALKSAAGASGVTIRLAKKGGAGPNGSGKGARPVLSLGITTLSKLGREMSITHDVTVKVKKAAEMDLLKEPLCPTPDVNILLPPLSTLRTVSERLKTIAPVITISSNWQGEFRLRAQSDEARVETEWRGLKHPAAPAGDSSQASQSARDPSKFYSVSVSSQSLLKFLASYGIANTTIGCVCEDHCAIFYVYIGGEGGGAGGAVNGGVLTFFLPSVDKEGDGD